MSGEDEGSEKSIATIALGTAGDCCILCGQVGINLPDDHGCQPNVPPPPTTGKDWSRLGIHPRPSPAAAVPPGSVPATGGGVAALLRTVAEAPEGNRNGVLYWAACRMVEKGGLDHEGAAYDLIHAAQVAGLTEREARATVRSAGLL